MPRNPLSTNRKPTKETNDLGQWSEIIRKSGEESRVQREKERLARVAFILSYFEEDPFRIREMQEDVVIAWAAEYPTLNAKYAEQFLASEKACIALWEEISYRGQTDQRLRYALGILDE